MYELEVVLDIPIAIAIATFPVMRPLQDFAKQCQWHFLVLEKQRSKSAQCTASTGSRWLQGHYLGAGAGCRATQCHSVGERVGGWSVIGVDLG